MDAPPAGSPDPSPTAPAAEPGVLLDHWHDGTSAHEPRLQVHAHNDRFFILRQSLRTNFEGPFLYLIVGDERALLVDSGAGGIPVAETVSALLAGSSRRPDLPLVVAHSHAHGDHVAGDPDLAGLPGTTVVGRTVEDVSRFFGIEGWPEGVATYDLGGRVLDVIPIPGHEATDVAFYDRRTGLLLTGDVLYPGRLYVRDFAAYCASVARLVRFTKTRPVAAFLGSHIEMTRTPGLDFPEGSTEHPDEHALPLQRRHLLELNDRLAAMEGVPRREAAADFIVVPLPAASP